jgi:hypothetical protein
MQDVGRVLRPDDDGVDSLQADLVEAADELVGVVADQLRAA